MSVKRALQIESDVVTSRSVVIPFEFKPETIPAGKNVGDSIVITPITVRTGFRIRPLLLRIDKADKDAIVAHAVITGGFMVLLHVLHVRAFTSNLLGSLVFNLSAGEQLQNMPLLYLLGLAEILTYFAVFSILIKVKDLPTPGREADLSADQSPYADPQEVCRFIAALGGPENIAQLGN